MMFCFASIQLLSDFGVRKADCKALWPETFFARRSLLGSVEKKKNSKMSAAVALHFQIQQSQELYQASCIKYSTTQILALNKVLEEVKGIDASLQFQTSHSLYSSRLVLSACGKIFRSGVSTNRKN